MNTGGERFDFDASDVIDAGMSGPSLTMSRLQRKTLAQLCKIREQGLRSHWAGWRPILSALVFVFAVSYAMMLIRMAAFGPVGYLFLGFLAGVLVATLRMAMLLRRVWPVYDAIIDWPRAYQILSSADGSDQSVNAGRRRV